MESVKSIKSEKPSTIVFWVKCNRTVNVFWINFNGKRVKYKKLIPGDKLVVFSYESHPWEFRDAVTGDLLVSNDCQDTPNRQRYYIAKATKKGDGIGVDIGIPGEYCVIE